MSTSMFHSFEIFIASFGFQKENFSVFIELREFSNFKAQILRAGVGGVDSEARRCGEHGGEAV